MIMKSSPSVHHMNQLLSDEEQWKLVHALSKRIGQTTHYKFLHKTVLCIKYLPQEIGTKMYGLFPFSIFNAFGGYFMLSPSKELPCDLL
jgi:hypothetical protein